MVQPAVDDAVDFARIRRVLVIKLRHHGDVLLTSPVFSVLRRVAPQAEVDALNALTATSDRELLRLAGGRP